MPVSPLPENPSLENLRHRAKGLLDEVRAGRPEALARVREFHPKGEAAARALVLSGAQLVVARSYGFASWPKLKRHVETIAPFRFDPTADVENAPDSAADTFVRLACLDYGRWQRSDLPKAQAMLEAEPGICASSIFAASAAGDVPAARAMLDRTPELAHARGGPFGWEPLLYACYSRLGGSAQRSTSTLDVARLLLERGADPNAGFLWQGNLPPFTALTGAFGEGEGERASRRIPAATSSRACSSRRARIRTTARRSTTGISAKTTATFACSSSTGSAKTRAVPGIAASPID